MRIPGRHRQQGAVIVTVCLLMLFLLGFMAFALDFGRLFIVKTELQTALDSCALSAAQQLNGTATAITRAVSAGITGGNLNRVDMQSLTWSGKGQVTADDISFRNATYAPTTDPVAARYAECAHVQPAVQLWLMQAIGAFKNDTATFTNNQDVAARAVATRGSAQSTCPLPLALKPVPGATAPDYGFTVGQWVTLLVGPGEATGGQIGWANLDGSNNAAETAAEVNGYCGTTVGDTLGTPGVQASVVHPWNARFGLYGGSDGPATQPPDFTGYSYTAANWPSRSNAYNGDTPAGAHPTADDFLTKRAEFASCADTGTRVRGGSGDSCESITGLSLNSFSRVALPGPAAVGGHRTYGTDRRIAVIPVVDAGMRVIDYSCMLMLQPLSIPMAPVQLEYLGNAGLLSSPCTTSGLPGGSAGPLVPVLVR
jgi:Flp pilus assembly protein TadG